MLNILRKIMVGKWNRLAVVAVLFFILTISTASPALACHPDITLEKLGPLGSVAPGQEITYTLNWGVDNDSTTNAILGDLIPTGTTFVSATGNYSITNDLITWEYNYNISAGTHGSEQVTVRIDANASNGDTIYNRAGFEAYGATRVEDDYTNTVAVTVAPVITLDKTGPATIIPGQNITYEMAWTVADADVTNLILTDVVPAGTTFVSANNGGVELSGIVTWDLGNQSAGASGTVNLIVTANSNLTVSDSITNTAVLDSDETLPVDDTVVTTVSPQPYFNLDIEKNANSYVIAGNNLTYTIDWEVTGNMTATAVVITDTLPTGVSFVSATNGGVYSTSTHTVVWTLGDITPNVSDSYTVVVATNVGLQAGTILTNDVEIISGNQTDSDDAVTTVKDFYLDITKTTQQTLINPGDNVVYTIDWEVSGNMTATDVVITDFLPEGLVVDSTIPNYDNVYAVMGVNYQVQTLVWNLGDITPNATGTIEITTQSNSALANGDTLVNDVQIVSGSKQATDSATTTVTIAPYFNLDITKVADKTSVYVGDTLTYTIDWEVDGNMVANNVTITDTLPTEVSLVSATGIYATTTNGLVWNLGNITPNATGTLEVVVTIDSLPQGGTIANDVEIVSGQESAQDDVTTLVTSAPYFELDITKTTQQTLINPGDNVVYTIDWEVSGNMTATDVVITDFLPEGLAPTAATPNYDHDYVVMGTTYGLSVHTLVWDLGDIAPNATGTIEVTAQSSNLVGSGDTLVNDVQIVSGSKQATDSATTTVTIAPYFNLDIEKNGPTQVNSGTNITWTINWSISGNAIATNVVITDALPTNAGFISATGGYVMNTTTNELVWSLGDITPNATGTLEVVVGTVGLTNGTLVTNDVVISSGSQQANDSATTSIYQGGGGGSYHRVLIEKLGPAEINAGEDINYTINWATQGTETALDVIVTDVLPANTIFYSATGSYIYATSTHTLTWMLGSIWPADSGSFDVVLKTDATNQSNGDTLLNQVDIRSGVETDNDSVTTIVKKGGEVTPNPGVQLKYEYPLEKVVLGSYTEIVTVINTGDVALTNGVLNIDLPENFVSFTSSVNSNYTINVTTQILSWDIPALAVGAQEVYTFVIEATTAGSQVATTVNYDSDQADANTIGRENITETIIPPPPIIPPPETPIIIPPVVAGEEVVVEGCQTCAVDNCDNCGFWLWLIIILLHVLAMVIYWFYVSKEEIKENEAGEYYIVKGSWAWVLPVFLVLAIIFLLFLLICTFVPFWAVLIVLVAYFLALASHAALIRKAELKYSPILPLLVTIIVLIGYLICSNWSWLVWVLILSFYVLTLVAYYMTIIKMDNKSRKYWWLVILFMTILTVGIEMVLRLCQCSEVIR